MAIILRRFQTFPMLQGDGSMADVPYATVAFVDPTGQQYAQLNVHADEVDGLAEGDHLVFSLGPGHDLTVPSDHAEAIMATGNVNELA
jgi:hypothetical protein